ncbi:cysteine-rich KTR domain-containing protein [Enterococcus faecium]|nr:cysteine-rich KTR domain-containing protein [Enterococcus faecium]MDG4600987.1 cysteine-rich KTR domain-containing protein [Enterococcus faecium]MDG4644041.1 cysteine-rich KTR domain-containing protein [Enterococcus faecium]MDG4646678.1 cysteine-rich KTR domain-containing protein [Enterococcus faecium]
MNCEWVLCPICGNKTRLKIRGSLSNDVGKEKS